MTTPTKRTRRYKAKYTADATSKRAKVLLPVIYPQMEKALREWDFLEYLVFPKLEALGVPEDQWEYYLAWVKRKCETGLAFSLNTRLAEYEILKAEFVTRGLDPDVLDAIEPFADDWVGYVKRNNTFCVIYEEVSVERNIAQVSNSFSETASVERKVLEPTATISESVVVSVS